MAAAHFTLDGRVEVEGVAAVDGIFVGGMVGGEVDGVGCHGVSFFAFFGL